MRIVIPGGNGHVGAVLARAFKAEGHEVVILSRNPPRDSVYTQVQWDGRSGGKWTSVIDGADVIINLAGRSVDCRYTEKNRKAILDSRVQSTQALADAIATATNPPAVWLNASTATIYRHALDRPMDEVDGELGGNEPGVPNTWVFSVGVALAWEDALFAIETPRTRKIALRSSIIMSPDRGGAFDTLLWLVRLGLGGASGDGRQFVSWIHEHDFVEAIKFLILQEGARGTWNITAPNPLPNRDFMRTLREAWGAPIGLPAAKWMIEIGTFFMRTESELVLKSRRVAPRRLAEAGFHWEFPEWKAAAQDLCERVRKR